MKQIKKIQILRCFFFCFFFSAHLLWYLAVQIVLMQVFISVSEIWAVELFDTSPSDKIGIGGTSFLGAEKAYSWDQLSFILTLIQE